MERGPLSLMDPSIRLVQVDQLAYLLPYLVACEQQLETSPAPVDIRRQSSLQTTDLGLPHLLY